jgi:hypothetical protein
MNTTTSTKTTSSKTTIITTKSYLKEGRRWPGSEWLKDRPAMLEKVYDWTKAAAQAAYPLMKRVSPKYTEKLMIWVEKTSKGYLFNCQMCGQCILHSTGMTCPMNCPKNLRNGPCGGVRANGHCEVIPELPCVWVQAYERSRAMPLYGEEIRWLQAPVNRALHNTSAWINMIEGIDTQTPPGWAGQAESKK